MNLLIIQAQKRGPDKKLIHTPIDLGLGRFATFRFKKVFQPDPGFMVEFCRMMTGTSPGIYSDLFWQLFSRKCGEFIMMYMADYHRNFNDTNISKALRSLVVYTYIA